MILLAILLAIPAHAQTYGGGTTITGTTNAMLQNNGSVYTNYAYVTLPLKTVLLSGISSTNETAIFSYGFTVIGQTNPIILASITNSFATGTNGGSWTTNVPSQTITIPIIPWAQASIGAFTNTLYVP